MTRGEGSDEGGGSRFFGCWRGSGLRGWELPDYKKAMEGSGISPHWDALKCISLLDGRMKILASLTNFFKDIFERYVLQYMYNNNIEAFICRIGPRKWVRPGTG